MATSSVDQVAAAILQFEESTDYRDFRQFHIEQARRFKRQIQEFVDLKTGRSLAKATIHSRLTALKSFFKWLAEQPGYKSKIARTDAEYFNSSANDVRIATADRERAAPSLDQIRHALRSMPVETIIQRRDRALIAFTLLSGARDDAIASMSLRHVDLIQRRIDQDARQVRTKNRKSFVSWFFPVGNDVDEIVAAWIRELIHQQLFSPDDPLFPATEIGLSSEGHFEAVGLLRSHWKDASAIRRIFKAAFESVGLPYFNPHSFRKTLVRLGEQMCSTPELFKAWSQNLGHEQVLTTFTSYGGVSRERQATIFGQLATNGTSLERTSTTFRLDEEQLRQLTAQLATRTSSELL